MKKIRRKSLSLLLALCLSATLFLPAYAQETAVQSSVTTQAYSESVISAAPETQAQTPETPDSEPAVQEAAPQETVTAEVVQASALQGAGQIELVSLSELPLQPEGGVSFSEKVQLNFSQEENFSAARPVNHKETFSFTTFGAQMNNDMVLQLSTGRVITDFGQYAKKAYDALLAEVSKGEAGTHFSEIGVPCFTVDATALTTEEMKAFFNAVAVAAYFAVDWDCSEMFYSSGNFEWRGRGFGDSYTFYLKPILLPECSNADARQTYRAQIDTTVQTLLNAVSGKSEEQKVRYFHDWLCNQNAYNQAAAESGFPSRYGAGAPWSSISGLLSGANPAVKGPVCEGYARAFKTLCDAADIPAILVVGSGHMWNNVYVDGAWKGIDVTWDDQLYGIDNTYYLTQNLNWSTGHEIEAIGYGSTWIYFAYPVLGSTTSPDSNAVLKAFVTRLYDTLQHRTPDAEGLRYWVNRIKNGQDTAASMAMFFVNSPEYIGQHRSDSEFLQDLYRAFFDRVADAGGMQFWQENYLNMGVSRSFTARAFIQSNEFGNLCNNAGVQRGSVELTSENRDLNLGLTQFIGRIYQKALGRTPDVEGLNYWTGEILAHRRAPVDAARMFLFSVEFTDKNYNASDYMKILYRTFFGREFDGAGLAYWLGRMDGGLSREDVLSAFAYSPEFAAIMAQYGL